MARLPLRERVVIELRLGEDRRGRAVVQVHAQYFYAGGHEPTWGTIHRQEIGAEPADTLAVWEFLIGWLGELQQEAPQAEIVLDIPDAPGNEVLTALVHVVAHELCIRVVSAEQREQMRLFE